MDLIELNSNKNKVDKYLRHLFSLALSQNSSPTSENINKTLERIMQSIKIVTISEREFVVSKGLFEIKFKIHPRQPIELYIKRISLKEKAAHYVKELRDDRKELELTTLGAQGFWLPPIFDKGIGTIIALLEIAYRTVNFPGLNSQMRVFLESNAENRSDSSAEYFELKLTEA